MGYKTKAIKSVSWMGALNISTRIISLVKFMIIARLLVPADLGAFGLVVFIVGVAEVFSELGIQTFLIQYKKNINKFIDSAWILQIIRGVGLFIIVALLAFPASLFFRQSVLFQLILLGALVPLIKSFENTYVINFQKELHFHKQFFYNLIIVVSDFLVSVTLAIILHSVLALVLGLVLSSLVGIIYSWVVLKTRPKRSFNREKIGEILHYGKWININSVIYYTITQMDTLFIGRLLGTSVLGLYQVSQNFSYTPMQEVADVVGQVNFPVYSKIAGDIQRFKKAYLKVVSALFLVELVIGIILFVFSRELILLFLGSRWLSGESIFRIFVVYGFIYALVGTNGAFFLSIGKQAFLTKINIIRICILIPLMLILIHLFGAVGAVYAFIISLLIIAPISIFNTVKVLTSESK